MTLYVGIRSDLGESLGLLKTMSDRIRNNKLVLYLVLGVLLIVISLVLFLR